MKVLSSLWSCQRKLRINCRLPYGGPTMCESIIFSCFHIRIFNGSRKLAILKGIISCSVLFGGRWRGGHLGYLVSFKLVWLLSIIFSIVSFFWIIINNCLNVLVSWKINRAVLFLIIEFPIIIVLQFTTCSIKNVLQELQLRCFFLCCVNVHCRTKRKSG